VFESLNVSLELMELLVMHRVLLELLLILPERSATVLLP
jgi:hypothetical protein